MLPSLFRANEQIHHDPHQDVLNVAVVQEGVPQAAEAPPDQEALHVVSSAYCAARALIPQK